MRGKEKRKARRRNIGKENVLVGRKDERKGGEMKRPTNEDKESSPIAARMSE